MSDSPGHPAARLRPRALPRSRLLRGLASEWGLSALALVLAVLVWAVVWGKISVSDARLVDVVCVPASPERVAAFPAAKVRLELRGPRRELEEAWAALGPSPSLRASVEDPEADRDTILLEGVDRYEFPFSPRLVESIGSVRVELFRREAQEVMVRPPAVTNIPAGYDAEVRFYVGEGAEPSLTPPVVTVEGPVGKVGTELHPDPVDVAPLFEGLLSDDVPPTQRRTLEFDAWRKDPQQKRYREDVVLPSIEVEISFLVIATEAIQNRLEWEVAEGYEVTVQPPPPELTPEQRFYRGTFRGRLADLRTLGQEKSQWWFRVRVPDEALPPGADPKDISLPVEWVLTSGLKDLRVRFQPPAKLPVVIRRAD